MPEEISSYTFLAEVYDRVCPSNGMVYHYTGIVDILHPPNDRVLDLCCGTGDIPISFARKGWSVTAIDRSGAMLSKALSKPHANLVKWLNGDISYDPLPDGFGLVTCAYDSINYILDLDHLQMLFSRVFNSLLPFGIFAFDTITPDLIRKTDEFLEQQIDNTKIVIQTGIEPELSIRRAVVSLVDTERERLIGVELHEQRGYDVLELEKVLVASGFKVLQYYSLDQIGDGNLSEDPGQVLIVCLRLPFDEIIKRQRKGAVNCA